MTWAEFHRESERLALDAQASMRDRNIAQAEELYKKAAALEWHALECIDVSKVRTRGITAVSAVALWFKAGDEGELSQIDEATQSELKSSFEKISKTLSDCPICNSRLSYKSGVCRNSLCVMHYEEFMA
jgi:hypothetical protein